MRAVLLYLLILGLGIFLGRLAAAYFYHKGEKKIADDFKMAFPSGLIIGISGRYILQLLLPWFGLPSSDMYDQIFDGEVIVLLLYFLTALVLVLPVKYINRFLDRRPIKA